MTRGIFHGIPLEIIAYLVCIVLYCVYNLLNGFLFYMGIYFYESGCILQAFKRAKYNLTSKSKCPYKTEKRLIRILLNGL